MGGVDFTGIYMLCSFNNVNMASSFNIYSDVVIPLNELNQ